MAVPFVAPFALAWDEPLRPSRMRRLGKLVAATSSAGAVALFGWTVAAFAPAALVPATVLFALGTSVWSTASQALWAHGPALFWLTLAGALLIGSGAPLGPARRGPRAGWAGLALGMAVITRPTTLLFAAATPVALLVAGRRREAALAGAGAAVGIVAWLGLNAWLFGAPFAGGYGDEASRWGTPLWLGAAGLLVAPSRGLLVYSPALVLAPVGLVAVVRGRAAAGDRALWIGWALAAVATWLVYAKWHAWYGGWCFGPRFLIETLPILGWLFAVACRDIDRWSALRRFGAYGLIAVSVGVHLLGVLGHGNDWNERHALGDGMFSLHDTQIEAHARELADRFRSRAP